MVISGSNWQSVAVYDSRLFMVTAYEIPEHETLGLTQRMNFQISEGGRFLPNPKIYDAILGPLNRDFSA